MHAMSSSFEKPGAALAEELRRQSEQEASVTPMDALLAAARRGEFGDDHYFKLLGRLWTVKRLMYYVYGGWALGINLNEYPPTVAYLFGKQIYDDSMHEMQYVDEILRRKWARTQRRAFEHPYCRLVPATRVASFIFSLRALANYPQNLRIAALNLGPKVMESVWLDRFAAALPDEPIRQIFSSQRAETRSHVLMGRLQVERFVKKEVDVELARRLCAEVRRDYLFMLEEVARFILEMEVEERGEIISADID
jgi:hypothetical protein